MKNYQKYLELEQKLIQMEQLIEELQEQEEEKEPGQMNYCAVCGKEIADWEDVEQTENELILTYKCATCGTYAEQHYKLVYDGLTIIE